VGVTEVRSGWWRENTPDPFCGGYVTTQEQQGRNCFAFHRPTKRLRVFVQIFVRRAIGRTSGTRSSGSHSMSDSAISRFPKIDGNFAVVSGVGLTVVRTTAEADQIMRLWLGYLIAENCC
jgi:hypothetical protein